MWHLEFIALLFEGTKSKTNEMDSPLLINGVNVLPCAIDSKPKLCIRALSKRPVRDVIASIAWQSILILKKDGWLRVLAMTTTRVWKEI